MSLLPVADWKTPTLLGDHGSPTPHRVVVHLKNGDTLGGTLRVAQETSLQINSGSAVWTLFASEWDAVEIVADFRQRGCTCPDDCNCHKPWRTNYCGCKQH